MSEIRIIVLKILSPLVFCLILFIFIFSPPSFRSLKLTVPGREPNPLELAYIGFAYELEDHNICYKIYEKSYTTASWGRRDGQVSYLRSQCLFDLACKAKNLYFCNDVKEVNTLFLNGSFYSYKSCLEEAKKGARGNLGHSFDYEFILTQMGYSFDSWPKAVKDEYQESLQLGLDSQLAKKDGWHKFYLKVIWSRDNALINDFKSRINKLPDFKE